MQILPDAPATNTPPVLPPDDPNAPETEREPSIDPPPTVPPVDAPGDDPRTPPPPPQTTAYLFFTRTCAVPSLSEW